MGSNSSTCQTDFMGQVEGAFSVKRVECGEELSGNMPGIWHLCLTCPACQLPVCVLSLSCQLGWKVSGKKKQKNKSKQLP